ncbi:MAG: O-antigen ligase family protein [Vicinamibacterales bacterium]
MSTMQGQVSWPDRLDRLATAGLVASVLVVPITKSVVLPIVGERLTLFEFVALPTILLWVLARTLSRSWSTVALTPALDIPLAGFWLVALLSGTNAYRMLGPMVTVTLVTEVGVLTYLLLLFLAARDLLTRGPAFSWLLHGWALAAVVVGVVGLVGVAEMVRCVRPFSTLLYSGGRMLSTFRNPNQLAAYMVPTSLVLVGLVASRTSRGLHRLAVPAAALSVAMLYFSASRGAAVAAVAGFALLAVMERSVAMAKTLASTALLVGVLIAMSFGLEARGNRCFRYLSGNMLAMTVRLSDSVREAGKMVQADRNRGVTPAPAASSRGPAAAPAVVIPLGSDAATSLAFRSVMARVALDYARAHPFIGIGHGTMHVHVMKLTNSTADVDAHNMTMTVLAETGFLGVGLFAWAIGWCAWSAFAHLSRAARTDPARALRAGMLVALLAFLVMTLSFDGQRQRVLWLLLAAIYASTRPGLLDAALTQDGRD